MKKCLFMLLLMISLLASFGLSCYGEDPEALPFSASVLGIQGTGRVDGILLTNSTHEVFGWKVSDPMGGDGFLDPGKGGQRPPLLIALVKEEEERFLDEEPQQGSIADPLEPLNRVFFEFNDKLYFWLLKPVATGYKAVAPEPVRVGIRNVFYNLAFPIRFVNCLLQGKVVEASDEIARFVINSTIGLGGLLDVAGNKCEIKRHEEDLGQTFGSYGMGAAFYIHWPILGPSSVRETLGKVGDAFIDPLHYLDPAKYQLSVKASDAVNETSLTLGDYEALKKAALDPYVAVRDAFYQNRQSKIKE
ncbi:MAG: VacJ family lipoprotein, partial [Pseudomonadota bacterium]